MFIVRSCTRGPRAINTTTYRSIGRQIRFQSTSSGPGTNSFRNAGGSVTSHAIAGLVGGGVVVVAGYSYYHFSGAKKVVDSFKSIKASIMDTKNRLSEKGPDSNAILKQLRQTAKSYAAFIPGGSLYVDYTFDSLDELASKHTEEVDRILRSTYEELVPILKNGNMDQETSQQVFALLKRKIPELQELALRAGFDVLGPILDKYPELRDKIGDSYDELRRLVARSGPEGKKILVDLATQSKSLFDKGFDQKSPERLQKLIQSATEQARNLTSNASSSGKDAWEKAKTQAQPYLDKFPEVKTLLNEKAGVLMKSGPGASEIWKRLKDLGEQKGASKEKVEEVKQLINKKAKDAEMQPSNDAWDKLEEFASSIPGADKLKEAGPVLKHFVVVVKEDNEEAKKLAEETFADIMTLLEEKAEKAKKLSQKTQEDAKESTKSKK